MDLITEWLNKFTVSTKKVGKLCQIVRHTPQTQTKNCFASFCAHITNYYHVYYGIADVERISEKGFSKKERTVENNIFRSNIIITSVFQFSIVFGANIFENLIKSFFTPVNVHLGATYFSSNIVITFTQEFD